MSSSIGTYKINGGTTMTKLSWRRKMSNVGRTIRSHNAGIDQVSSSSVPRVPEKSLLTKPLPATVISPTLLPPPPPTSQQHIGIVSFLKGKNYFVTGSTGFLAKVLIEKMMRSVPDVGKMYLLIKAKDKEAAMKRLKSEIIGSELFKCLQQKLGKSYSELVMSKLVPVVGDISKPDLGLDAESVSDIVSDVDVIISSAASTSFDERFDVALNTNTRGPGRLMALAKKCKKLCLFLHVSTAYANGEREGVVSEKPFFMGESIAGERAGSAFPLLDLDLDAEFKLVSQTLKSVDEKEETKRMKELGLERARMYGWQNVYVFTKAMGEMVINNTRGDIPVVIIRPSVVESTYKDPFPGWIQGNRMLDPLILSYGKGLLPRFSADPDALIDVVPADMVVNATIAAMAKHGIAAKPEINVYHVASSMVNPLDLYHLFKFSSDHFVASPLMDSKGQEIVISEMEFLRSADEFSSYIWGQCRKAEGEISDGNGRRRAEKLYKKKAEHLVHLAKVYEPYMFYKGWFDNGNTLKLNGEMSKEEKNKFGFEMRSIMWRHFLVNIHIPGLKKHVMMIKQIPN